MNPNRKVLVTLSSLILALFVIACSCSSLIPGGLLPTSSGNSSETIPGLAGTWQDTETSDTFVIAWVNNQYVVKSVTYAGTSYEITSQSWSNNSLTWTYYIPENDSSLSYQITSLSGDNLETNWWNSSGSSGTETLSRVP